MHYLSLFSVNKTSIRIICLKVKVKVLVAQSCLIFCDPMDWGLPGFSVHRILQARILEWVSIPSPGDLPDPGIEPGSPALHANSLLSEPYKMVSQSTVLLIYQIWSSSERHSETQATLGKSIYSIDNITYSLMWKTTKNNL